MQCSECGRANVPSRPWFQLLWINTQKSESWMIRHFCLHAWGNLILSYMLSLFCLSTNSAQASNFLQFCHFFFSYWNYTDILWGDFIMILICITLMISDVECFFMYPLIICRSSTKLLCPFFKSGYLFICYWVVEILVYFWSSTMYQIYSLQIFSSIL